MDSKMRMNYVEGDRVPDDLIHKIISFLNIREAIATSVLSSKWRFIWTSMPYLNFSTQDFTRLPDFSKFVNNVLSRRNNLTQVYSMKLTFRGKVSQGFFKRIMNYAFSHNIQQLNVACLFVDDMEFPLCLFSSHALKFLSITRSYDYFFTPTSTWVLPALTTLDLDSVTLCDDFEADKCVGIFSKCANLKNLTLKRLTTKGSDSFTIFHPRLSNLTLENDCYSVKVANVVAPQLENLTIRDCYADLVISAPHLASLLVKDSFFIRGSNLTSTFSVYELKEIKDLPSIHWESSIQERIY